MTDEVTQNTGLYRLDLRGRLEHHLIGIAPAPIFSRLEALHDRVTAAMEMLSGMPIGRRVTATHMTAGETQAQMDPAGSHFQAFLTALGRNGLNCMHLSEMGALHEGCRSRAARSQLPNAAPAT